MNDVIMMQTVPTNYNYNLRKNLTRSKLKFNHFIGIKTITSNFRGIKTREKYI